MSIERIADIGFERAAPAFTPDGVPISRNLILRDSQMRLRRALEDKAGQFLDYLEDEALEAIWLTNLEADLYLPHNGTFEVPPNSEWNLNTVGHFHEATHLDSLASRGTGVRSRFELFTQSQVFQILNDHWREISDLIIHWNLGNLDDQFQVGNTSRLHDLLMQRTQAEHFRYIAKYGDAPPQMGSQNQSLVDKWQMVLSMVFASAHMYRRTHYLKGVEKNMQAATCIPWSEVEGPSCVVFRGFHRGTPQKNTSDLESAVIGNSALFNVLARVDYW